jgi:hypothetical protein
VGALAAALALTATVGHYSRAAGEIIYVDADAEGGNNGNSWASAFTDLQTALDAAVPGDQIWVAHGVYKPTWQSSPGDPRSAAFQLKNQVALYGGFDPSAGDTKWEDRDWQANSVHLSGDLNGDDRPDFANNDENSYHVFYHPAGANLDSSAILDGFAISRGNADGAVGPHWFGGGMYNQGSSPTLANCHFWRNAANHGGGLYNGDGSSPILTHCTFSGNWTSSSGGGMENSTSSPTLTDCIFSGNSTVSAGGGMQNAFSSPVLTNCTFSANSSVVFGGGMFNSRSSPTMTNCAFVGNTAGSYGGAMHNHNGSMPALTNCTFYNNSAISGGGAMFNQYSSSSTLTNSILWGDSPDEISTDYQSTSVVTYSDIQGGHDGEGNIDADPRFADPNHGDIHLGAGSPCVDAGANAAPDLPDYDFEGDPRIIDGNNDGEPIVDMGVDEKPLYFVDADATAGANDGTSWENAFTELQTALDLEASPYEVWVAEGTYKPTAEHGGVGDRYKSFQLRRGVALYGGFDPSVGDDRWEDRDWQAHRVILSGDLNGDDGPEFANNDENSYHVFYNHPLRHADRTAVLDGFTITAGNADADDYDHSTGGGAYNEGGSPTLANCTFVGNSAVHGGGLVNVNSNPMLANCILGGNLAITGGGMANYDSFPTLINCTLAGNSANAGGGILNYTSVPRLTNSIMWDNVPAAIGGDPDSFAVVTYSDIQGGHDGEGNIDADPLFVDPGNHDFHLRPGSPCIDAGTNDADLPDRDFEGDARILDGDCNSIATVDMGVDEVAVAGICSRIYLPLVLKAN